MVVVRMASPFLLFGWHRLYLTSRYRNIKFPLSRYRDIKFLASPYRNIKFLVSRHRNILG